MTTAYGSAYLSIHLSSFPYMLVFAELATSEVRIGSSIDLRMIDAPHPFYQCIAPLRGLLLKEMDPEKWATIQVWHEPTTTCILYFYSYYFFFTNIQVRTTSLKRASNILA